MSRTCHGDFPLLLLGLACEVEAEFSYEPGFKGDRTDPPEGPEVEFLRVTALRRDDEAGLPLPCPQWLEAAILEHLEDEEDQYVRAARIAEEPHDDN